LPRLDWSLGLKACLACALGILTASIARCQERTLGEADEKAIRAVVEAHVQALATDDADKLRAVWHEEAGTVLALDFSEPLESAAADFIAGRSSPQFPRGHRDAQPEIIGLKLLSERHVVVTLKITSRRRHMLERPHTLTLLRTEAGWKILRLTYTFFIFC
jgi:hypothetical protein